MKGLTEKIIGWVITLLIVVSGSYGGNMLWKGQVSEKVDKLEMLRVEDISRSDSERSKILEEVKSLRSDFNALRSEVGANGNRITKNEVRYENIMSSLGDIKEQLKSISRNQIGVR